MPIFCQLILEFCKEIWIWLTGHFWSVAKVTFRIGCATWNSNLKRTLILPYSVLKFLHLYPQNFHFHLKLLNLKYSFFFFKVSDSTQRRHFWNRRFWRRHQTHLVHYLCNFFRSFDACSLCPSVWNLAMQRWKRLHHTQLLESNT